MFAKLLFVRSPTARCLQSCYVMPNTKCPKLSGCQNRYVLIMHLYQKFTFLSKPNVEHFKQFPVHKQIAKLLSVRSPRAMCLQSCYLWDPLRIGVCKVAILGLSTVICVCKVAIHALSNSTIRQSQTNYRGYVHATKFSIFTQHLCRFLNRINYLFMVKKKPRKLCIAFWGGA